MTDSSKSSDSQTETNGTNGNGGVLNAKLPGGFYVNIKGQFFAIILVLAVTTGIMGLFAWKYVDQLSGQHDTITDGLEYLYAQQREIIDQLAVMNYLLSLPQDKRPELTPPASLSNKLRELVTPKERARLEAKHEADQTEQKQTQRQLFPKRNAERE